MATDLSASDLLIAENIGAALKIGASFDWKGAAAAFESGTTEQKIVDGLIAADDVAKIVGVFVPPVAVIANDVGIAISVGEVAYSVVQFVRAQPSTTPAGTPTLWGRIKTFFTGA